MDVITYPCWEYLMSVKVVNTHQEILINIWVTICTWWRHQMETFAALLAIWAGNSPVTGEFPAQRPVTRSFVVFFDLHLNKRLSKQWWVRLVIWDAMVPIMTSL